MSEIEGFIVAGYERDRLVPDWDGEVYATRAEGDKSLSECHMAGYAGWALYELRAVTADSVERQRTLAEVRLAAVRRLTERGRKTVAVADLLKALSAPAAPSPGDPE